MSEQNKTSSYNAARRAQHEAQGGGYTYDARNITDEIPGGPGPSYTNQGAEPGSLVGGRDYERKQREEREERELRAAALNLALNSFPEYQRPEVNSPAIVARAADFERYLRNGAS